MKKTIRVGTWNVNAFNPVRSKQKARLLNHHDWDILLLQEVAPEMWDAILSAGWDGAYALSHLKCDVPRKAHGVAIVVKEASKLSGDRLIPAELPVGSVVRPYFPARLMSARITSDLSEFEVVAFHSHHAAKDGLNSSDANRQIKMALYSAVHQHLRNVTCGAIGMDANSWGDQIISDDPDPKNGWYEEHLFHHHGADHGFRDTWHQVLKSRPELLSKLRDLGLEGQDGSLAVTYQRSKNGHIRTNRMDRVYVTSQFKARNVEHHYADALAVGSDHALVIAELESTASSSE